MTINYWVELEVDEHERKSDHNQTENDWRVEEYGLGKTDNCDTLMSGTGLGLEVDERSTEVKTDHN